MQVFQLTRYQKAHACRLAIDMRNERSFTVLRGGCKLGELGSTFSNGKPV